MFSIKILTSLFFGLVLLSQVGTIFAAELPNFTSCVNPEGEVKASYESGIHGIAGRTGTYEGKDSVYSLSSNALTQCFCANDGSGIQTNWLKASGFSDSEIKVLISEGWIYIPNGALWGLDNSPYLASNSDFSCKSSSGGNGYNNGSASSSASSSGSSGTGSVLGSAVGGIGQVLGLASTGNITFLFGVALTSLVSTTAGLILKKRSKKITK